jgi:ribosomal protein L21E
MEAKYKVGEKVNINWNGRIIVVEVFGSFKGQKEIVYSVKTSNGFLLLQNETDILEKTNE